MTPSTTPASAVDSAVRRLRSSGLRLTPARRAVLEVLARAGHHLSSPEVLKAIAASSPRIGRASVFRALEALSRLSIIRPTYLGTGSPAYVLMTESGHHAHIVCPRCRSVVELSDCRMAGWVREIEREHRRTVTGHLLELYGLCPACEAAGVESGTRR